MGVLLLIISSPFTSTTKNDVGNIIEPPQLVSRNGRIERQKEGKSKSELILDGREKPLIVFLNKWSNPSIYHSSDWWVSMWFNWKQFTETSFRTWLYYIIFKLQLFLKVKLIYWKCNVNVFVVFFLIDSRPKDKHSNKSIILIYFKPRGDSLFGNFISCYINTYSKKNSNRFVFVSEMVMENYLIFMVKWQLWTPK